MKKTQRGYKVYKNSSRVEVVLNKMESYESTAVKACSMLGIKTAGSGYSSKITLLRMSGAVIPNKEINGQMWTIGRYVDYAFSTRSNPNIGLHVHCVDKVSFTFWRNGSTHRNTFYSLAYTPFLTTVVAA